MNRIRSRRSARAALAGIVGFCLFLLLGAGACEDKGTIDAPIDSALQDNTAPLIVNGPNHFHNLALKCIAADLIAVHTREAAPVITPNSSACAPGVAEKLGIPRVRGYVPPSQ